ncbi:hypothetical protein ACFOSC_13665 [Streptantibioticus rubrisoli]|uniref:Uncharacterized protein n=1 Tax=Streptantibioticus rubrisoli TaxID=1387313 RepID=A0ABT1PCD3_9ACTN|nr:hypothetical protein [Streptantibioticus rubrisoli]MCQ4043028.1 hypothetical protein [Streptantibioticus rubrisoli]
MAWVDDVMVKRAGRFLWTSGRVLEQRRFAFLLGGETDPAGVLAALDAYRRADGGYAFGLEPDVRGPVAQPISLPAALRVLEEARALDATRGRHLCDWLAKVAAPDGDVPAVLPTLRPYPRPPWLPIADEPVGELLATGQIAGPLLRHGIDHPWLKTAMDFCRRAIESLQHTHPYEAEAAITFLDAAPDPLWARQQSERLGELVREQRLVLLDPDHPEQAHLAPGYAPGEYHLPHDFAPRPDSLARAWFTEAEINRGLSHLAAQQQQDGGWPIRWARWSPTTEVEARPSVTLAASLTLRAYDQAS